MALLYGQGAAPHPLRAAAPAQQVTLPAPALSSAGQTDEVLVQVDGRHDVVGPSTAVYGRTLHDDDIHTPQYRALVAGALYMAFKDLGEVVEWVDALVVGLPVYSFGKFREALAAQMGKVSRFRSRQSFAPPMERTRCSCERRRSRSCHSRSAR